MKGYVVNWFCKHIYVNMKYFRTVAQFFVYSVNIVHSFVKIKDAFVALWGIVLFLMILNFKYLVSRFGT